MYIHLTDLNYLLLLRLSLSETKGTCEECKKSFLAPVPVSVLYGLGKPRPHCSSQGLCSLASRRGIAALLKLDHVLKVYVKYSSGS